MKLTDDFVRQVSLAESKSGQKYADGHGFYLHVKDGGKYWRLNYIFAGRRKTLALGVYPKTSLDEARHKANSAREVLKSGIDPSESKKATKQVQLETVLGLRPKHPGEILRDVVLPGLSLSVEAFADLLNVPTDEVFQIINERSPITCNVALKLEQVISVKAESWMTMQQTVDLWDARTELKRIHDFGKSIRLADFTAMPDTSKSATDASSALLVARVASISKAASQLTESTGKKG